MFIFFLCWILPPLSLSSHDVLIITPNQSIVGQTQCEKWNRNISTCSLTIEYMDDLMQKNAMFSDATILDYVFDACQTLNTLGSDEFAGKAWDYITSQYPKHCMIEPNTRQYLELLKVYWFATKRKNKKKHSQRMMSYALQVVQHWIKRYRNNPKSLSSRTMRNGVDNKLIFNQINKIIRNYKYWDVERKKCVILFHYQEATSLGMTLTPLQIIWDNLDDQQNDTQARLNPHLKYPISTKNESYVLQSTLLHPGFHQLYLTLYQQWTPNDVIHHFEEEIMGKQMVPNHEMIAVVLDACCKTADVKSAEKIWKYTLSNRIKPNQIMFSKMLSVLSDYNMYKCGQLCIQWIDAFQADRASLIQGINMHQIQALNFKLIPQQMIRIVLFNSRWEMHFKLQIANSYYNLMILLGILPDPDVSLMVSALNG